MITEVQAAGLRRAIRKLVLAEIAFSWSGVVDPADEPLLKEDRDNAKDALERRIARLREDPTPGSITQIEEGRDGT